MSWTLYKDLLCSADGTLDIGKTATRWKAIWGDTITGGTLTDGTASLTAGAGSGITTLSMNNQLTNTLAIGTSPFAITSTTVNTNLNSDLLDGLHGADYLAIDYGQLVYVKAGDTIQATIDAISDEGASKIYTVIVPTGVYDEKIVMAPYINLLGVDRDGTIIKPSAVVDTDKVITGASNSTISNLSVICATYVGDPGAPSGSYHGIQFTAKTSCRVLNTFIDIVNNSGNYAVDILGGSPVIDGVETDGVLHTIVSGTDPAPTVTNCHFGNTDIVNLDDASMISNNVFDRLTTSNTLANYATISNCSIYGISSIGGDVVISNCVFWEDNTGNVAVGLTSSPNKTIFQNCTFRALDDYALDTGTGLGAFYDCTFLGGTNSPALYMYHHSDGLELYNCTLLKNGTAVVAIDCDSTPDGATTIQNCWMNSGVDADATQTAGNTYQINSDLTIGDVAVNGGNITSNVALSVATDIPTSTSAGRALTLASSDGFYLGAGGQVNITAGDGVATDSATAADGGDVVITTGNGYSVGTPGPANAGGDFIVNLGYPISAPGATNGKASIVLDDGSSASTVLDILGITRSYTGTAAAGIGAGFIFKVEDASGNIEEAGNIDALFPTATHAGQTARMNLGTLGTNVLAIGTFGANLWTVPVPPAAGAGNGLTLTASNAVTNGVGGTIALTGGNAVASGGNGNAGGSITLTGGTGAASGPPTAYGGDINLVGGAGANRKGGVLIDAGLTVGSTTSAGDNNLRVEGTSALVGDVTCTGDVAINGGNITSTGALDIACAAASAVSIKTNFIINPTASADQTHFYYGADDDIYLSYGSYTPGGAVYMRSINSGTTFTLTSAGNCTIAGTLTVNGDQTGATDHVFDAYDDITLLEKWRSGEDLPFERGDMLNRDRLLRDTILQQDKRIKELSARIDALGG